MIPGAYAVGRVAATGPDTTSLTTGQLVLMEPFVRGRDDGNVQILWGGYDGPTPASKRLMAEQWRDAVLAEYVRAPLENTWVLDEQRLCGSPAAADEKGVNGSRGGLGLAVSDLVHIATAAVVYGGMRGIDLKAGETIVVAPATGLFSCAAVAVADAMGANVIAASRNAEGLAKLTAFFPRVRTVVLTGDVDKDTAALRAPTGPVDAFMDVSPPQATGSSHLAAGMAAVRQYGRISLMGGRADTALPINHMALVFNNLTIRGQYMYERDDVRGVIRLVESGLLRLGKDAVLHCQGEYTLGDYRTGFREAASSSNMGGMFVITP
jgi:threonine dehydrogenase-like Zn-dependent dehydrogenase